ncbi:MAG: ribosomal protein S18-alanine N-acetyltransferase [Chakrabartia sp.]
MTKLFEIIPGDIRSVDAIMPVMRSAFDPTFGEAWTAAQCAGMLSLPGTVLFLAVQDERVLGFALVRAVLDESELLLIATTSEERGKGIGKGLLAHVINWCQHNAIKKLLLEVRSGNPALELYKTMGFTEIGRRENYYLGLENNRFDALTLQLTV